MNIDSEIKYVFVFQAPDGTYQEIKKLNDDNSCVEGLEE